MRRKIRQRTFALKYPPTVLAADYDPSPVVNTLWNQSTGSSLPEPAGENYARSSTVAPAAFFMTDSTALFAEALAA